MDRPSKIYKCPNCGEMLTIRPVSIPFGKWYYPYREIVCKNCMIESNLVGLDEMTDEERESEKWVENHVGQWRDFSVDRGGPLIEYNPIKCK